MGTLQSQKPRAEYLSKEGTVSFAREINEISKEAKISYTEALETYKTIALIQDYDVKDEQLMGFGDLAQEMIDTICLFDKTNYHSHSE